MSHAKPSKQRTKVIPVLGVAGLSLSLAGEAPAATGGLAAHLVTPNNEARHELALGEEEIFDVTLATFYVVNEENPGFRPRRRFATGGGGGCGCCVGCAAATGDHETWTPGGDANLPQRSIKPAHPPKRTHVPKSP